MAADPNNLIWIDLEMTGLDPDSDYIIEIATIVTDAALPPPAVTGAAVAVRRSMDNFNLDGVVRCQISGDCYRCLKPAQQDVEARFRLLVQRRQASPEELESAEEDGYIAIVDPGMRQLDLREYIREAVILDLPVRIPTPDTEGRCPQCGEDLAGEVASGEEKAVDPRWAALGKIEFSQTEEST